MEGGVGVRLGENEATNVYESLRQTPSFREIERRGGMRKYVEIVAAIFPQSGVGILKHLTPLWSPFYNEPIPS